MYGIIGMVWNVTIWCVGCVSGRLLLTPRSNVVNIAAAAWYQGKVCWSGPTSKHGKVISMLKGSRGFNRVTLFANDRFW